jgi:hypothetical protein
MCLHPPQAYNLGRFIGKAGTSKQTATFVATHSSQILRGVLQTAVEVQIVRLSRSYDGFAAKRVDSKLWEEVMRTPTVRADTVLDGIFAQAVTVIEADGDRIVYQAAWEVVGESQSLDIHFAAVGGTGGIADTCQFYKVLGIPVAVIADLDLVTDVPKFTQIVKGLAGAKQDLDRLLDQVRQLATKLQALPPTLTESETRAILENLSLLPLDWAQSKDRELRKSLSELANRLNGMRGLKRGGVGQLPDEVAQPLRLLIEGCRAVGLFLVPVGELEYWLTSHGIAASKEKKWAWANEASEFLRNNPAEDDDIWAFMTQVGQHLRRQLS